MEQSQSTKSTQTNVQSPPPAPTDGPQASPQPTVENTPSITAIGDSVILDAAPFLEKLLPGIVVDGKIGRQMSQLPGVIDELRSKNLLGKRIIIELGTNGAFNPDQLRGALTSLGDMQQIIIVNTRVPRDWQDHVNATLSKVAAEFPQAMIVDWYKASKGKENYFVQDGVHLKAEGASYYASLLSEAVHRGGK
ncbi:O-acetyltransferase OatA [compost metagenome]